MNEYTKFTFGIFLICICTFLLQGCSTQKDNAANRGLQNLSARYNYIYNSNVLLDGYQEKLSQSNQDSYDNFLAVYIAPAPIAYSADQTTNLAGNKELDEIAQKAQAIVAEKALSNYVDEAYMLLGKTNFYKGNFFTASEYFDYTARAYKSDSRVYIAALTWKARSLMQLESYDLAVNLLDSVKTLLDTVKKKPAEPLATLAQMSINKLDYKQAITFLEQAIKQSNSAQSRTRWPYILAQLYEHEKDYEASLKYYTKVEHSNAPFEMYFNAKLSKLRIVDYLNDHSSDRKIALLKLLKDDKNFDYTDQIYYEVAEDYFADKDYDKAGDFYKLSANKSTINPYQKGVSYLRLADLNFKNLGNYINAKLYYDSAAKALPKNYPGYAGMIKKAENLEYLTQRYQIINRQDSLQLFAKMPEQARSKALDALFEPKKELKSTSKEIIPVPLQNNANNLAQPQANGSFYFSNSAAITTGFTDFRKRWGNRVLEENWRQSLKYSAQITQENQTAAIGNVTGDDLQNNTTLDKAESIKSYTALLPITAEQVSSSNQKIIDAYFEIASFYQQVLEDPTEATKVYEVLLARFPGNNHLSAIYYSLYLNYSKIDQIKAENYKNLVLKDFPNSVYARTILDPNFSAKQNALDLEVNKVYNEVFSSYEKKDFSQVITGVNEIGQRFPGNSLQAQYDYLKAIAIGRTQHVDSLISAFEKILVQYPQDLLVTPLVKEHLSYVNANLASYKARKVALIDFDGTEPRFIAAKENLIVAGNDGRQNTETQKETKVTATPPAATPAPATVPSATENNNAFSKPADNLFNKAESNLYYYVIAVADVTVSVSSSRFGVGQFNRGNFSGTGLKHQLQELEEDQLIFVGNFETISEAKEYAAGITPQLPKIMKVPATKYTGFFVTKENFDKIKNRETLNRYIEFFKTNY